jgi:hypothetical protein
MIIPVKVLKSCKFTCHLVQGEHCSSIRPAYLFYSCPCVEPEEPNYQNIRIMVVDITPRGEHFSSIRPAYLFIPVRVEPDQINYQNIGTTNTNYCQVVDITSHGEHFSSTRPAYLFIPVHVEPEEPNYQKMPLIWIIVRWWILPRMVSISPVPGQPTSSFLSMWNRRIQAGSTASIHLPHLQVFQSKIHVCTYFTVKMLQHFSPVFIADFLKLCLFCKKL